MFWSNYALKWMYYLCIHLFIKSFILYTCMYKMYILYANVACKQTFFRSLFFFIIYYYTNVTFSLYERCYLEKGIAQLHRSVGQNFSKRQGSYHRSPGGGYTSKLYVFCIPVLVGESSNGGLFHSPLFQSLALVTSQVLFIRRIVDVHNLALYQFHNLHNPQ